MKKKVIILLDHAPDYREEFLRTLSAYFNLIVIAHSCNTGNLTPPKVRSGYKYHELKDSKGISMFLNYEFLSVLRNENADLICIALNVRHPYRIITFLLFRKYRVKWFWWGQIIGKSSSKVLLYFKKWLIKISQGGLTYSNAIVKELNLNNVVSFNNSQFSEKDYQKIENTFEGKLKCIFVGRPQERKKLESIILLAALNEQLSFRLIGPGMPKYFSHINVPDNVSLYDGMTGNELAEHFEWSNLVLNPGHVGLLVMNAACHHRAIVINSSVKHAPEVILAKEADQFFLDFSKMESISEFLTYLSENPQLILRKGEKLFELGKNNFTVEYMAHVHKDVFYCYLNR